MTKNTNTKAKRNLASGFDDVANSNTNSDDKINNNTDNMINSDTNKVISIDDVNNTIDVLDGILEKKKSTRVQRGLYLDRDVDVALNKLTKGAKKGIKSDVVNALLKEGLEKRGAL